MTYLSPAEVARRLSVSPRQVMKMCQLGQLRAVKIGKLWRIPEDAIDELGQPSNVIRMRVRR